MRDQADRLRQLVLDSTPAAPAAGLPVPPLVVVAGGKGGVGATTVAVNLAVTLARQRQRIVLVDANFQQPDVAVLCGLDEHDTVADVLSGKRTVHEALQRGPAGIRVLPGAWASEAATNCSARSQQQLIGALERLGDQVDLIVLDTGSGRDSAVQRFWQAATLVLLVTTPDSVSILDAYAAIKLLSGGETPGRICTVVNRHPAQPSAGDVQARIAQASARFLGLRIFHGPAIPSDPAVAAAVQPGQPLVLAAPNAPAARGLATLAAQVAREARLAWSRSRIQPPLADPSVASVLTG